MLNKTAGCLVGSMLIASSAMANTSGPTALTADELDAVSAGNFYAFQTISPNRLNTVGALSFSFSEASSTPGMNIIINAGFNAKVGLSGNGTTFVHTVTINR